MDVRVPIINLGFIHSYPMEPAMASINIPKNHTRTHRVHVT